MYQCVRCGADVLHANQLCHACRRSQEHSDMSDPHAHDQQDINSEHNSQDDLPPEVTQDQKTSHSDFNDFDTILSMRGPKDLENDTASESTSLLTSPVDHQTPQIILDEPDRTEINHQPPSHVSGQSSHHQVRSRRNLLSYQQRAEEPILDQTIAEDPEDYEQIGLDQYNSVD